jgi:hypothetical protein
MHDNEIAMLAATILGGFIAGERAAVDEKTLKRALDLAFRLKSLVAERQAATVPLPPTTTV